MLEVKTVLYSIWYRHTYRWPSGAQVDKGPRPVCTGRPPTECDGKYQMVYNAIWPPDDVHNCAELIRDIKFEQSNINS